MDWTLLQSMDNIMDIIYDYIAEIDEELVDNAKYIFENSFGQPLIKQVKEIFWEKFDHQKITDEIYDKLSNMETIFFPWAIEKIKELSHKYTLFLTTWSATQTALRHLQEWWIKDLFAMILWSDKILKGREHIEEFITYTWDADFAKKAVYTWDWEWDKLFAGEFWIDFIRIWKIWKDKYETNSVAEIDEILEIL